MEKSRGLAHDDKVVLRKKFRDIRREFKSQEGRVVTEQLEQNLLKFVGDFRKEGVQFCLYRARRDEAPMELSPVTDYYFPTLLQDEMEFRRPHSKSAFQSNALAFEEPLVDQSTPLDFKRPLVVFCPAVALDHAGGRLGLGKGHYDRFFAKHPDALRVGVVFQVQLSTQALPAESWDQAMDWIVTEKMILRVPSKRSSESWI